MANKSGASPRLADLASTQWKNFAYRKLSQGGTGKVGAKSSTLQRHMPANYKRVARMTGYCLFLGEDAEVWNGFTQVISARLTVKERAAMAWATLRALPPDGVVDVASTVLPKRTAPPNPPLHCYLDDAAFWADQAEPEALDAYALAIFNAMTGARQRDFFEYVSGRRDA